MGGAGRDSNGDRWTVAAVTALVTLLVAGGAAGGAGLHSRPAALAAAVATAAWLITRIARSEPIRIGAPRALVLAALVTWAALSALWSDSLLAASLAVGSLIQCAVVYLLLSDVVDRRRRLELMGAAVAAGALVPAAVLVSPVLPLSVPLARELHVLAALLPFPQAALVLAAAVPVGAALYATAGSPALRGLGGLAALTSAGAIVGSGSQAALAVAALSVVIWIAGPGRAAAARSRAVLVAAVAIAGIAAGVGASAIEGEPALGFVWRHPIVGAGAGAAGALPGLDFVRSTLVELGLVGGVLLVALVGKSLAGALGGWRDPEVGPLGTALAVAFVGSLVAGAVSGHLPGAQFWLLAALSSAAGRVAAQRQREPSTAAVPRLGGGAATLNGRIG